jgi:hypothetical protein
MPRTRALFVLVAAIVTTPAWGGESRIGRPDVVPQVTVPVTTIPGAHMGCVVVPVPSTRAITGFRKVHAFACFENATGEVLVAVLRKNGTVLCSGSGFLDPQNAGCATLTACGSTRSYCLF